VLGRTHGTAISNINRPKFKINSLSKKKDLQNQKKYLMYLKASNMKKTKINVTSQEK